MRRTASESDSVPDQGSAEERMEFDGEADDDDEDEMPAVANAPAYCLRNLSDWILSKSFSLSSSEKPASSMARRPEVPPVSRASSVACSRRRVIAPLTS